MVWSLKEGVWERVDRNLQKIFISPIPTRTPEVYLSIASWTRFISPQPLNQYNQYLSFHSIPSCLPRRPHHRLSSTAARPQVPDRREKSSLLNHRPRRRV